MKTLNTKTLIATAVIASMMTACATTAPVATSAPAPVISSYAPLAAAPVTVAAAIPEWYMNQPESTPEVVWVAGTAISRDLSMSTHKAQLDAETHLANKIAGEINTLTKDYKRDVGDEFVQSTEIVANKIATDVKVIGGQIVKKITIPEGGGFRTYVLLKFPLGNANHLLTSYMNKKSFKGSHAAAAAELEQHKLDRRNRDAADSAVTSVPVTVSPAPVSEVSPLGLNDKTEEN